MTLQLLLMFGCVLIGLVARRFAKREQSLIVAAASAVTLLYLFFPDKFIS